MSKPSVTNWSCEDVRKWMIKSGFSEYAELFCYHHKIDGEALLSLQEADLRQPPLKIDILGDIKRISLAIQKLQEKSFEERHKYHREDEFDHGSASLFDFSYSGSPRKQLLIHNGKHESHRHVSFDSGSDGEIMEEEVARIVSRKGKFSKTLEPEIFKTVLSFLYSFMVFLLTSFVMVISHDRVPDPRKYPPLPDLFLDNIPLMPWAFEVCELACTFLFTIWCSILFFHKHRFILMRRMFSMLGTIFLLRCVTMLITSLSVPGVHLQCDQKFGSWYAKVIRTYEIWSGFGMSIHGVKSCGDYMFSGHTCIITLLNFFITEYAPRRMYFIHTVAWVSNLFGIFFILAAHEHYSIDVFIAFYISSRLFLYYHTLANNRSLMLRDKRRRKIWFPLFSYFESHCDGIVPNEYEWPLPYPVSFIRYFEKKTKRH